MEQQAFFFLLFPSSPFFKGPYFKCHEIPGNGSFPWSTAMQVKNYYSCISVQYYIEI